ncbi:hypothetical protein KSS87_001222 [Heliosperma pusillum]|nr:hypothetical protein KSS87_001222 [Heliosperma pusillum]
MFCSLVFISDAELELKLDPQAVLSPVVAVMDVVWRCFSVLQINDCGTGDILRRHTTFCRRLLSLEWLRTICSILVVKSLIQEI